MALKIGQIISATGKQWVLSELDPSTPDPDSLVHIALRGKTAQMHS